MVHVTDEDDSSNKTHDRDPKYPSYVVTNIHRLIRPPCVLSVSGHRICCKKVKILDSTDVISVLEPAPDRGPRYPIDIRWYPRVLNIEVKHFPVIYRLLVTNACYRSIYLRTCGFLNESIRLGSWWRCFPRTRFLLAPGLSVEMFIHAVPRRKSKVGFASSHLRLVAEHMRDQALIYYDVEMNVTFNNYEESG